MPGVEKVVEIEGTPPPSKFQPLGGVAVIARNTWAAIKGRDALKITGTTARTATTTRSPTGPSSRTPRASPARSCATRATSTPR